MCVASQIPNALLFILVYGNGQAISIPQHMAECRQMWSPSSILSSLSAEEKKKKEKEKHAQWGISSMIEFLIV